MLTRILRIAIRSRRIGVRLVLGCIFCTLLDPSRLHAQSSDWHFRFDLFQMLFEQNGLRPIQDIDAGFAAPERTVIVVLGNTRIFRDSNRIQQFLDAGGAMLLASDRRLAFDRFFHVLEGPALSNQDADIYAGHRDCIRVRDFDASHPLVEGVGELIVNRSGWILEWPALSPNAWRKVARIPATASQLSIRGRTFVGAMTSQAFIVVADHSLFTNSMMWHGDNAVFAINVSNALCKGPPGKATRDQVLFLVDDTPSASYLLGPLADELNLPMPPPDIEPDLDVDQMFEVANKVVAAVEDSDSFNQVLANRPRQMAEPYYRRALLFALSGALIAFAAYRLGSKTSQPLPVAWLRMPKAASTQASKRAKTKSPHLNSVERGKAAQKLAQHFCQEVTSSEAKAVWVRELSGNCALRNEAFHGETSETLKRVLSIAVQDKPSHFTDGMLLLLAKEIAELRPLFSNASIKHSSIPIRQA